jgi:putative membrane protein
MKPFILCLTVLLTCVGLTRAADKETLTDKQFIALAVDDGINEVKMGELAGRLASSDKVKDFARMVVKDHKAANKRLLELASAQKLAVVTDMKKDALAIYNRMSRLNKAEFDKAYIKQMVEDHEKAAKLFERAEKSATDPDVKRFAADTLPTLRKHLKRAREIRDELKKG